jgi:hypothetical protein
MIELALAAVVGSVIGACAALYFVALKLRGVAKALKFYETHANAYARKLMEADRKLSRYTKRDSKGRFVGGGQ